MASGRVDAVMDDVMVLRGWLATEAGACCKILGTVPTDAKIHGEGAGKLLPLARVTARDDQVVEVENYASVPVRLTKVRREEP